MEDEPSTWEDWTRRLADDLERLPEGGFVNTWGPARTRDMGTGLFGRKRRPHALEPASASVLRTGDHLFLESVRVHAHGDDRTTEEVRERLRGVGWLLPGDHGHPGADGQAAAYLPAAEIERAAAMVAGLYPVMGVDDPAEVRVDRGS